MTNALLIIYESVIVGRCWLDYKVTNNNNLYPSYNLDMLSSDTCPRSIYIFNYGNVHRVNRCRVRVNQDINIYVYTLPIQPIEIYIVHHKHTYIDIRNI